MKWRLLTGGYILQTDPTVAASTNCVLSCLASLLIQLVRLLRHFLRLQYSNDTFLFVSCFFFSFFFFTLRNLSRKDVLKFYRCYTMGHYYTESGDIEKIGNVRSMKLFGIKLICRFNTK